MSEINYQVLRDVAEAIKIAATPQKLLAFRMKATPQVVLELLDEREAQSKRIAELEANFATLAVENVGLNKFIKDDCFIYTSDDISPRDANGFKPETPATDAFLADIQAVAFNELRAAFVRHAKVAELDDADTVTLKEVTEALLHCAEQIRAPE
ncbi:TPA: ead/Ea22-like family protein [Escherichia coli]|nr:ead/Ea22-like family protein [Escherichia coli]EHB4542062.1 ead/Ea22-like family protein [Escherichia coli]MCO7846252.1 ead/Ea22-like family protein [Escherichia coli]MCO7851593.1 ead/Ea22-like family protein [Escherichia coli]MCO7866734.1 ead/Ea22-like family protein [Escherichia coli]MCU6452378.1 ead/Ea22-like family protein [Escherichia coli]